MAALCGVAAARAEVRLPALLSDHMVLQRDRPIHVWGWADPGEPVEVSFLGQSASTIAASDGRWSLYLEPAPVGGPHEMRVQGANDLLVRDVLVGDVWVGSGQSNMRWTVAKSNAAADEIAAADFPEIRLFIVELASSEQPLDDVEGEWRVCSPETVGSFSAVLYYFGRELHQHLRVPFGLIRSSAGGTGAHAWTSWEALEADKNLEQVFDIYEEHLLRLPAAQEEYERKLEEWKRSGDRGDPPDTPIGPGHVHAPAAVYNAMLHPLLPLSIRGVAWYQGENEAQLGLGRLYARLFPAMIADWRARWGIGDFPFFFVQLSNYALVPEESQWPEVREAQRHALSIANTAMAVTVDIGDSADAHLRNKQDVGRRLALAARAVAYGEDIVHSGPMFRQMTVEGSAARLWFDHVGDGLRARGETLGGFEIAPEDGCFEPAAARIEGETVVVSSPRVERPVAVRYGWKPDPVDANLYNANGLPASPFQAP